MNIWSRNESGDEPIYSWPIDFQQVCQDHSMEKKIDTSTDGAGTTGYPHKRMKLEPYLYHIQKINQNGSLTYTEELKLQKS